MKDCIDLRPICKERSWKWRYEESFKADHITPSNPSAPWYVEVLCQYGTIYPKGGDELLACVEGHGRVAAKLQRKVPEVRCHQGNVVFRFPLKCLDAVAAILKPRRKRQLRPEQIARAREVIMRLNAQRPGQSRTDGLESANSEGDR